jgi:hypothetical protein
MDNIVIAPVASEQFEAVPTETLTELSFAELDMVGGGEVIASLG